jgi:hypothetical protein
MLQEKAKEMVTKSTAGLTQEQAIAKAARENPELYAKYLKEMEEEVTE